MKLLNAAPGLGCVSPTCVGGWVSSPPMASRGGQVLTSLLFVATILVATPLCQAATQAPVNLGSAGNYVILAKTGITDVPPSPIVGNIGASPITGAAIHITCAEVTGTISAVDAAGPAPCSLQVPDILGPAILDMATAYTDAAGRATPDFTELYAGNLSGKTLVPGLYKWSTNILVDATGVTLSGGPNAVWIFQIAGDVLMANGSHVTLAGGARAMNVFWQVGGPTAVTLGTGVVFAGNILSNKQVIMNTGASIVGRAFAFTQVTLQSTAVTSPGTLVNGIPPPAVPTVTSTTPANLATLVPVGNSLIATFSEAMNPTTVNTLTFTLKHGVTPVVGTVTPNGVTATFVPLGNLLPNTLYTATITTGAKDPEGVALAANYVWTFTTAPSLDLTPPTVISTIPTNGATNVPVASVLSATFSEAMNPLTVTAATFLVKQGNLPVTGVVSYSGITATFQPLTSLAPNTQVTATITTGVTDLAGNAPVSNHLWTFTTGGTTDTIAPVVSFTIPSNGAVNVPLGNALSATFSEAMNPTTINNATFTLRQGNTSVAGVVTYAGVTATFKASSNLAPNLPFTATITTGAKDVANNALAANYSWSFNTGATPDTTPPTISSTIPASGAANVPVGNALSATFSEAMDPHTITTATFSLMQGSTPVAGVVTYTGVSATFKASTNLGPNLPFTATITTGAKDLAGNALASNYIWTFTTGAAADTAPPTVSATIPLGGATNVPVGNGVSATFSEAMDPLTINPLTFSLKQ
ncbi:MAG: Ig-like domain-containing protein, partial [Bryobacteraceae bacterium]